MLFIRVHSCPFVVSACMVWSIRKRIAHRRCHLLAIGWIENQRGFGRIGKKAAFDEHGRTFLFADDRHEARAADSAITPACGANEALMELCREKEIGGIMLVAGEDLSRVVIEIA